MAKRKIRRRKSKNREIKGVKFRPNATAVSRLSSEVVSRVDDMHRDIIKQVEAIFTQTSVESIALDASITLKTETLINRLVSKWRKRFNLFASNQSDAILKTMGRQANSDLNKYARKLSSDMTIKVSDMSLRTKDIIRAKTIETTSLIKTLASGYLDDVETSVMRSITTDSTSLQSLQSSIHEALTDRYKRHRNKAKNVSLDQTRKVYQAVASERMRDAGLNEFIWRHAGGSQQPREHHRDVLNGQTFSLDDLPVINTKTGEKGKPGDEINCKCFMEPVIRF
ncbi:putative Phage_Mu_F domain-containing protein [Vibrio chagasii]|nr:putative Phage_Mu_F domain-containing protein [Vibrio chagasii]